MSRAAAELERRLGPWISEDVPFNLRAAADSILDVFRGLNKSALEEAALKDAVPYIRPRERILGSHTKFVTDAEGSTYAGRKKIDRCYDMLLSETIGR
eukprot:1628516-Pleurochrysis_carterae.AAC.1